MSRMGRDYLKVGYYTESFFAERDIRYIAINDGVDSDKGDNDFTPFRNLFNDFYARDASKKIRDIMWVKGNAGEHLCTINWSKFLISVLGILNGCQLSSCSDDNLSSIPCRQRIGVLP